MRDVYGIENNRNENVLWDMLHLNAYIRSAIPGLEDFMGLMTLEK